MYRRNCNRRIQGRESPCNTGFRYQRRSQHGTLWPANSNDSEDAWRPRKSSRESWI